MATRAPRTAQRAQAIPVHATELIGRKFVLEQLELALDGALVLWGPPGIGKSRLAHALAQRWYDESDGDAWVVDLSDARSEAEALGMIASAVGLSAGSDPDEIRMHVQRLLRRKRAVLLVLDHCEHLVDAVQGWRATWSVGPKSALVATSRRRLDGFEPFEVPALTEDEALRLLEQRARRVRESFRLDDTKRGELTQLVAEVDALPAALELVGARLMLLTPAKLLERLKKGAATLRDALAQSWELLHDDEQRALRWLAATRGGFDLELAEAMLGDDALDVLEALVQHAWLHVEETPDGPRMRLLHEAQRFVVEIGVPDEARAAHATAIIALAEVWDRGIESPDEVACTRQLVANLPNLWTAWEATEGGPAARGPEDGPAARGPEDGPAARGPEGVPAARGREATNDQLVRVRPARIALRTRIGLVLHMTLQRGGDHTQQDVLTQTTLRLAEEVGDPELVSRARLNRARVLRWKNEFKASLEMLEASLDGADPATKCSALRNLGAAAWSLGDLEGTRRWADRALATSLEIGTVSDEINSRNGLGFLLTATGELTEAREHLERALRLAMQEEHATGLVALVSSTLAGLEAHEARWLESERHSSRAIEIYEDLGYRRHRTLELLYRAEARVAAARVAAAMADAEEAESAAERWAYDWLALRALFIRGVVELAAGAPQQALEALEIARARLENSEDQMLADEVARACAAAHLVRGETEPARQLELDDPLSAWLGALARGEDAEVPELDSPVHQAIARSIRGRSRELVVGEGGRTFSFDGGAQVDLTRRKAMRQILHALAERHRDDALTLDEILEAGWPGEVMTAESGSQRVYVTIKRLRDLGLEPVLLTVGDGYMLDPAIALVRV